MPSSLKLNLQRICLLLIIYSFIRGVFYVLNSSFFMAEDMGDLLISFLVGLRFDLSAIVLLNLPLLLLSFFSSLWRFRYFIRIEKISFFVINALFIIFNYGDVEFFKFSGRRLTWDVFKIQQDIQNTGWDVIRYYWPLASLCFLSLVFLWWKSPKYKHQSMGESLLKKRLVLNVFFLVFIVISARGGLQFKPLKPIHATQWTSFKLSLLSLNSTFTLLKTPQSKVVRPFHFMSSEKVLSHLRITKTYGNDRKALPNGEIKNIFIIILESFSLEYIGAANNGVGYTPFLDKLIMDSLFFKHSFANGRRSIEVLPSVLCSLPALMDEAFITSKYQQNQLVCLSQKLKPQGFKSHFFHGADNGSMFFDSFTSGIGFDKYWGRNEFEHPEPEQLNIWGIHDEPFFQFTLERLKNVQSPFLSVLFSLSSHNPYSIPDPYKGQFPKGELEIHESIGYTDFALEKFFERAKKQDWYNETLFVITADHTQKKLNLKYADTLGSYRVPILFFHPKGWKGDVNLTEDKILQHIDIMPSLLDLLNVPRAEIKLGRSFNERGSGRAFNYTGQSYWYLTETTFAEFDGDQAYVFSDYDLKSWDTQKIKDVNISDFSDIKEEFQAFLQFYSWGMSKNKLYEKVSNN